MGDNIIEVRSMSTPKDKMFEIIDVSVVEDFANLDWLHPGKLPTNSVDPDSEPVDFVQNEDTAYHGDSTSLESLYGKPVTSQEASQLCPPGEGGLVYHVQLVNDSWTSKKDCTEEGDIKPRRPLMPVRQEDFFKSLVQTVDGRWLFSGIVNGWPGLTCLEVRSITCLAKSRIGIKKIVRFWDSKSSKKSPSFPRGPTSVRVTLRAAPWSCFGWTESSKGFVWWFESQRKQGPRLTHGENMVSTLHSDVSAGLTVDSECTNIHMFTHRYARPRNNGKETRKEKLTYHSCILLEWDHGEYLSIVELATLNGVGGRNGKANWYHDKLSDIPILYQSMPACMILPWKGEYAEIRVHDIEANNLDEFKKFVEKYKNPMLRFVDPHFTYSNKVRISYRKKSDIQRYLLNYIGRDMRYRQEFRNCQTFAADFYGFLAGKADIEPFHPVNRVAYRNRAHNFLYSPEMYGLPHRK